MITRGSSRNNRRAHDMNLAPSRVAVHREDRNIVAMRLNGCQRLAAMRLAGLCAIDRHVHGVKHAGRTPACGSLRDCDWAGLASIVLPAMKLRRSILTSVANII